MVRSSFISLATSVQLRVVLFHSSPFSLLYKLWVLMWWRWKSLS